ncbi:MAG: hypothetical protein H6626_06805 [Pseudobdellovibrionaceae bacterium]|nr:hypothetical protein [Bdellovibrionales bacterium]USN48793.1 MAG: hypothetical protein H6626_06805 [Pseudobdellovibrionaceae bacterium]
MKYRKFKDALVEDLKDYEAAKAFLLCSVEEDDDEFLLDAIRLIVEAWGPSKISEMAGGSRQKWDQIKNPTYQTVCSFLAAFGLKLGAVESSKSA